MSTKTTFKRIALVTVAALSFGTMAAISPASAAATAIKVSDVTVYGYVGETMSAKINVTFTGTTLSTTDSVTIKIKDSSKPSNAVAIDTTTATAAGGISAGQALLVESSTVSTTIDSDTLTASSMVVRAGSTTETAVAYNSGQYNVRFVAPGTYKFAVTVDSATSTLATAPATYTGATLTYVVLSAGAATGDGGVATPFNTAGGVAGAGNYNQVTVTGQKGTTALGTRVVITGSTIDSAAAALNGTLSSDKTTLFVPGTTSADANTGRINVLTPTAGTVTVNTYLETSIGTYSATASNTVTITVRATGQSAVYSYNETYMSTGVATPDATTDAAAVLTAPKADAAVVATPTATANIVVDQYDVLDVALPTANTKAVTVEITGAGRVSQDVNAVGSTTIVVVAAASANSQRFYIHPDGRSGTGTVVVKVDGVEALKRTVSFYGVATQLKLVAATTAAPNPTKSYLAVGGTMTISVLPYDANNIKLAAASVTATSDTATVASVLSTSYAGGVVTVTGVAVGKTNINIKNGTLGTLVVPVEVTKSTGKAVLTLDKTSAQSGEKVTWTITATDSNGRPTADGTSIALFSSITSNMSVTGLPTGSETLTGGVSTGSFFAPLSGSGTLIITATQGTAHDTYIAGLAAATTAGTTYTAVKDVVNLDIVNAAVDAATAAGEAAEAAAQDATDAALDATTAAEAAGALAQEAVDLVTELSAEVTKLIAGVRASITYLTKLVMKLAAKK